VPNYLDEAAAAIRRLASKYEIHPAVPRPNDVHDLGPRLRGSRVEWYEGDPVSVVSRQYPESLREQAIEAAKGLRVSHPLSQSGKLQVPLQGAVEEPSTLPVLAAFLPGRSELSPNTAGLAIRSTSPYDRGLVALASKGLSDQSAEALLLHEMRHTLEGGNALGRPSAPYVNTKLPARQYDEATDTFYRMAPADKNYLGRANEEAVRFADARARYANEFGRLIDSADEAEEAARMALANERGLGEGFHPSERLFYRLAREASPEIRAHQNTLLQRLLTVAPLTAATVGASMQPSP
jgi:hypothetical protein